MGMLGLLHLAQGGTQLVEVVIAFTDRYYSARRGPNQRGYSAIPLHFI